MKHDVVMKDGKCWCCDQNKNKTPDAASKPTPVATGGK
jgi:hypothetical protein